MAEENLTFHLKLRAYSHDTRDVIFYPLKKKIPRKIVLSILSGIHPYETYCKWVSFMTEQRVAEYKTQMTVNNELKVKELIDRTIYDNTLYLADLRDWMKIAAKKKYKIYWEADFDSAAIIT